MATVIRTGKAESRVPCFTVTRGDARTHRVTISVPRRDGGVDLSGLYWRIKVVNAAGQGDVYPPHGETVTVNEKEILFEWLIYGVATAEPGDTAFSVMGVAEPEENAPVRWESATRYFRVNDDLDAEPSGEQEEALSELDRLIVFVSSELNEVIAAGEAAKEAASHPPIIGENGNWYVWDWETSEYVDTGKSSQGIGAGTPYVLPTASTTVKGGVKIGDGLQMDGDVLGVKPNTPEFIVALTVGEVQQVILNTDSYGNVFSLKSATVLIERAEKYAIQQIYIGVAPYKWVSYQGSSSNKRYVRVDIEPIGGGLWRGLTSNHNLVTESSVNTSTTLYGENGLDTIHQIVVLMSNGMEAGTKIMIYGVRA